MKIIKKYYRTKNKINCEIHSTTCNTFESICNLVSIAKTDFPHLQDTDIRVTSHSIIFNVGENTELPDEYKLVT
jgi:hypothetical protein